MVGYELQISAKLNAIRNMKRLHILRMLAIFYGLGFGEAIYIPAPEQPKWSSRE